jgi:hypothetical protein
MSEPTTPTKQIWNKGLIYNNSQPDKILKYLQENEEAGTLELCEALNIPPSSIRAIICILKQKRKVYVSRWEYNEEFGYLRQRAIYVLGDKRDAKKLPKKEMAELRARHLQKKRFRVSNVFDLGVPLESRRLTMPHITNDQDQPINTEQS